MQWRRRRVWAWLGRLLALGCLPLLAATPSAHGQELVASLRQPVALRRSADDSWLFVANRRSGSVTVIDLNSDNVTSELQVGQRLSDLALLPDGCLLVVDEAAGELVLVDRNRSDLSVVDRLPIPGGPVSVAVAADGAACSVASLWGRRLTLVRIQPPAEGQPRLRASDTLDLPFSPRRQLWLAAGQLLTADAFGGQLAVVEISPLRLVSVRSLPGHNIRGLALAFDGKNVLLAQQVLDNQAETNRNDVHWGVLLTNVLRWLPIDRLLDPTADACAGGHVHQFGDQDGAGGDPADIAVAANGVIAVPLAGVGRLAHGKEWQFDQRRIEVGRRPIAIALSADGSQADLADPSEDCVWRVDLSSGQAPRRIALGPTPALSLADEGERLFYDARLSLDGWYSCHSCHTDGHTCGQRADTLGDGSYGAPKRILTLLGAGRTGPWGWNGGFESLEEQVRQSLTSTLQGPQPSGQRVAALAAYLRSLDPPPAAQDLADADAIEHGRVIYASRECQTCHAPPTYTSASRYDVGLSDELGAASFNPPSLLGAALNSPYLHDGRAKTLEDLFLRHGHPSQANYTVDEARDLAAFLRSL